MAHPKARTGWLHDDPKVQREFERVGQFLANDDKVIRAIASALGSTPEDIVKEDPKDIALWALTIFIDGKHLNKKKVVQGVNYIGNKAKSSDPDIPLAYVPIEWIGKNVPLHKDYRTIDDAERSDLEAWATIPLADLTSINGPMSVVVYRAREFLNKYGMKGATFKNTVQLRNDEQFPNDNYYYGTDEYGDKGWHPLSNVAGRLEVDFDYSDLNSGDIVIGDIPANKRVFKTSVLVETEFDDDTKITIGDDVANGRLATVKDTELEVSTSYDIELEIKYVAVTSLKIYKANGTPSTGSGTAIIYYS